MPQSEAGIRMDPPMSVPTPTGLARAPAIVDSPPLLPPEMRLRFVGWTHCPNTWLYESDIWHALSTGRTS